MHPRRIRTAAIFASILSAVLLVLIGDWRQREVHPAGAPSIGSDASWTLVGSCASILIPHGGDGRADREIAAFQALAERTGSPGAIERLAWAFVAKARESGDPGHLRLAEECSRCLESREPGSLGALLVRGHVLHGLHRFREAEEVARKLVAMRMDPSPFDHGLLGDALMEQGKLDEAIPAYETMLDLRPGLESWSRGAHVRWIRGDLAGALDLYERAARASSFAEPEPAAWVRSRIAALELQKGDADRARRIAEEAIERLPGHAPSHFVRAKALLAQSLDRDALDSLRECVRRSPLPEHQWALADVLRSSGDGPGAQAVERDLEASGAAADPRTFSLYLATRRKDPVTAVRLAEAEIEARADVHTQDALAWALLSSGRPSNARPLMEKALREGTEDARLFLHAGVLEDELGSEDAAGGWLRRADDLRYTLLPSEADELRRRLGHP